MNKQLHGKVLQEVLADVEKILDMAAVRAGLAPDYEGPLGEYPEDDTDYVIPDFCMDQMAHCSTEMFCRVQRAKPYVQAAASERGLPEVSFSDLCDYYSAHHFKLTSLETLESHMELRKYMPHRNPYAVPHATP